MEPQQQIDLDVAAARARARNLCSRQLAASVRIEEALQALATAIDAVLPGRIGYLLRCTDRGWHGWLSAGDDDEIAERVGIPTADDLDVALAEARYGKTRLWLRQQLTDVLLVPAGPPEGRTLLAVAPGAGADGIDEAAGQLCLALAAEAWGTLRRIELAGQLEVAAQATLHAGEQFQQQDRQRADYVAGITHDLRSPVTAVVGFARTLREAGDLLTDDERAEALESIERQSRRMSRMLDDMLDSARADAGQLVGDQRIAVPLHLVVNEAVLATAPDQRPRLRPALDVDVTVRGDADQLTRVAHNLIANAVRYAPGSTPIGIGVHRDGAHGLLTVSDRGPGIPAGLDVFARFGRGDVRGTGLGLFTVKRIVELHEGTITLTTTPGGGTTMTVRLPCFDPDG